MNVEYMWYWKVINKFGLPYNMTRNVLLQKPCEAKKGQL